MTDETESRDSLVAYARESFDFLATHAGRAPKVDDGNLGTTLVYVVGSITVEVDFDWRDRVFMVLLCRTVNGRRPPGYYMHEGRRVRTILDLALADSPDPRHQAVAARLYSTVRQTGTKAMRPLIDLYATELRAIVDRCSRHH